MRFCILSKADVLIFPKGQLKIVASWKCNLEQENLRIDFTYFNCKMLAYAVYVLKKAPNLF